MSFLTSIAARAAGIAPTVQPRLASRYESEAAPEITELKDVGRVLNPPPAAPRPVVLVPPQPREEEPPQQQQPPAAADGLRTRPTSSAPSIPAPLRTLIYEHVIHEHEHEREHETTTLERRADFQSAVAGPPVQRPAPEPPQQRETPVVRPEVERRRTGGPRAERPTIRVTIGRVDVRAVTEAAAPTPKREAPKRAVFTIEDYIRLRREGRR